MISFSDWQEHILQRSQRGFSPRLRMQLRTCPRLPEALTRHLHAHGVPPPTPCHVDTPRASCSIRARVRPASCDSCSPGASNKRGASRHTASRCVPMRGSPSTKASSWQRGTIRTHVGSRQTESSTFSSSTCTASPSRCRWEALAWTGRLRGRLVAAGEGAPQQRIPLHRTCGASAASLPRHLRGGAPRGQAA